MKHRILIILGLLVVAACLLAVVLLRRNGASYRSAIPEDAQAVLEVDLQALVAEGGLTLADAWRLFRSDDVEQTGLLLTSPFYAFLTADRQPCILLPLADAGDFRTWLESQDVEVERQQGLQWAQTKNAAVVFDSRKAVVVPFVLSGRDVSFRQKMAVIMKKTTRRFAFDDVLQSQAGAAKLATTTAVVANLVPADKRQYLPSKMFSDAPLFASMSIRRQSLLLNAELLGENELTAEFNALKDTFRPIRGDLFSFGPEQPSLWLTANVDGSSLLRRLRDVPTLRTFLLLLNFCIDADRIIEAVDGDVSLAFAEEESRWLFTAQLSNTAFLQNVPAWQRGGAFSHLFRFSTLGANDFALSGEKFDVRFGVRENTLYVTPDELLASQACRPGSKAVDGCEDAKGCLLYGVLDAQQFVARQGWRELVAPEGSPVGRLLDEAERVQLRLFSEPRLEVELLTRRVVKEIFSEMKRDESD